MLLNAMNLTKSYHDITVIDDFSFHIDSNENCCACGAFRYWEKRP